MTTLKGVASIGDTTFNSVLKTNILTLFDWGFIDIGAYYNVNVPTSGAYGGNFQTLHNVNDPNFTAGTVWEGSRKNWVWETGMTKGTPIAISGVYVNDVLLTSGYYIDYNNGRVVFDSAQTLSSDIHIEYSHKWIDFVDADDLPMFQRIQRNSFRVDDGFFALGSGMWTELAENRVQLPAVAVEIDNNRSYRGVELGSPTLYAENRLVFHVFAEQHDVAAQIAHIISLQEEKTHFLFDVDRMISSGAFPLDWRGALLDSTLTYPNLIKPTGDGGYRWTSGAREGKTRFFNSVLQDGSWLTRDIYQVQVSMDTETILYIN
jgi:hypothetical protein